MHLERSEVFKGALLKVESLPRVRVGRVLRGNALVQTGQKIESQGWTDVFFLIIIFNYLFSFFVARCTRGGLGGNSNWGEPSACRSRETS